MRTIRTIIITRVTILTGRIIGLLGLVVMDVKAVRVIRDRMQTEGYLSGCGIKVELGYSSRNRDRSRTGDNYRAADNSQTGEITVGLR